MSDKRTILGDRIEQLEEAQDLINQAVELIDRATRRSVEHARVRAYLIPVLEMAVSEDNEWLGLNQCSIQSLIETFQEETKLEAEDAPPDLESDWKTAYSMGSHNDEPTAYKQWNGIDEPIIIEFLTVRDDGRTNMFHISGVQSAANELKLYGLVLWIEDHKRSYGDLLTAVTLYQKDQK